MGEGVDVEMQHVVLGGMTVAATVVTTTTLLATEITQGTDTNTYIMSAAFAVGSAVLRVLWKRWENERVASAEERRISDERREAEMVFLRERNAMLTDRLLSQFGYTPTASDEPKKRP